MTGSRVLVTGCSSGIGLATVVELVWWDYWVVATMRDLDRSDRLRAALAAAEVSADLRVLDVADDAGVAAVVAAILADRGGIDAVVSNAGIGIDGTTEELTVDEFRASFETNVLGTVRLLHAVLPTWRAARAGRFVAVSSVAGALGMPFNDAYCSSKFALEGLLESLHPVLAQHGIHVSIVEPGPVVGTFAQASGPPAGRRADGPYAEARGRFQAVQDAGYESAQTNEEIAAVLAAVVAEAAPRLRYQTSDDVARLASVKLKDVTGERVTGLTARWI